MKKVKVRVWEMVDIHTKAPLFVSYPEGEYGHKLYSCLSCGEIYAVTLITQLYSDVSIDDKLEGVECVKCKANLSSSLKDYPENYLISGSVFSYKPPYEIPPEDLSKVIEVNGIYE